MRLSCQQATRDDKGGIAAPASQFELVVGRVEGRDRCLDGRAGEEGPAPERVYVFPECSPEGGEVLSGLEIQRFTRKSRAGART
jgi:hypothetical protein